MAPPSHATRLLMAVGLTTALVGNAPAQHRAPTGRITGRIVDQASRQPVEGARVAFLGTARSTASDTGGRFTQAGLGGGTYLLEIRAIGYGVTSWIVRLADGEVIDYDFEILPLGVDLAPVVVRARPTLWERRLQEFDQRRKAGRGVFITEEEILASNPASISDLLRDVPGLRLMCRAGACTIRMTRGPRGAGCAPDWVVDGLNATYSSTPSMPATGVIGIEVYRTATETPVQFLRTDNVCGSIVIWTKSGL